ncbi:hypothetical protein ACFP1Z_21015 [Streptomyces gamaensis]|uniref:Lipoprotein n=1 Tax=Streptomyces gamaensis TaxID=1763542 RepID=A0ABW0Z8D1_9ACTN
MAAPRHRRTGAAAVPRTAAAALALLLPCVSGCVPHGPAEARPALHDDIRSVGGQARAAGDDGDPGRARAALRRAARLLADAGGARVRTSMETVSGGTRLTIRGAGEYDFARPVGQLTVLVPADAAGSGEQRAVTEVFAPGALYMKNRGAGVPAGKWVRLATPALPDGNLLTSGATDPLAAAELLGGARQVTYMRDERIDGVPVKHYWGTIDLGQAARLAPERDRAPLAVAAKGFSGGTVAFDVYLDEQGRPRRLRHRFSVAERGAPDARSARGARGGRVRGAPQAPLAPPAPMSVVSTVELDGFGTPVDVRLPAPADIYTGTVGSPRT